MTGLGRVLAGGVTAVLLAAATMMTAPAMAVAQTPTVVVTPDHLVHGQRVLVETSGFPSQPGGVVECAASVVGVPSPTLPSSCRVLSFEVAPLPQREVPVFSVFTAGGQTVDCHRAPGCVVGFWSTAGTAAYAPVTFAPGIAATPLQRNLSDGATVEVTGGGIPAGDWTIAQCERTFLDDPTPARAAALCAPPMPVSPDAAGAFTADLVVHDPLIPSGGGGAVPCGYSGCVVVLSEAGQRPLSDVAISFGPPLLTVTPSRELFDGRPVEVVVSGAPGESVSVAQCLLPLGSTFGTSTCAFRHLVSVDRWGSGASDTVTPTTSVGEADDCRTDRRCALVMTGDDGSFAGEPVALTFRPPPTVGFAPTSGLLDGQPITVRGRDVPPGEYQLFHCYQQRDCADPTPPLTVGRDGVLRASVPARQRFTGREGLEHHYCRSGDCRIVLHEIDRGTMAGTPYEMATGALTATPDTGLRDGRTVRIRGNDLMSSYDGPPFWVFPTGGWALTQCDAAVLGDLTLAGTFTHCSVAPPTRDVTVGGSTLDTTLDVRSSIIRILGGTTDCTASPGACVVGLVRLEQDGSLSSHLRPIAFAP